MKAILSFAVALLTVSPVSAHYRWDQLNSNPVWQYIRESTNDNSPVTDLASNDLRCNVGTSGVGVNTTAVKAGDSFTFSLDIAVYHQGPITAYMSKAPTTASEYAGDGDWFKIAEEGPTFSGSTATWPLKQSYTYKLPTCLAAGDYLLRVEQLAIHNPYPGGIPQVSDCDVVCKLGMMLKETKIGVLTMLNYQFYISCAQITVSGGTGGTPTPTTKIPGHVKVTDPGYTANVRQASYLSLDIWTLFSIPLLTTPKIYNNFNSYTIPGPKVVSTLTCPSALFWHLPKYTTTDNIH